MLQEETQASWAYKQLSAAAGCVLDALSGHQSASSAVPTVQLGALMEGTLERYERGCSVLSLLRYSPGAGAAEHVDMVRPPRRAAACACAHTRPGRAC